MRPTPRVDALLEQLNAQPLADKLAQDWTRPLVELARALESELASERGIRLVQDERVAKFKAALIERDVSGTDTDSTDLRIRTVERDEARADATRAREELRAMLNRALSAEELRDAQAHRIYALEKRLERLGDYPPPVASNGLREALEAVIQGYVPEKQWADHQKEPHREGCPLCMARAVLKNPNPADPSGEPCTRADAEDAHLGLVGAGCPSSGLVGLGPVNRPADAPSDITRSAPTPSERPERGRSEWIPVSEPPGRAGEYLCRCGPDFVIVGHYYDVSRNWRETWDDNDIMPSHWMPLPDASAQSPLLSGRSEEARDALRLRWMAETMQDAYDSDGRGNLCNWNGTLLMMVLDRFHKWRKLPPNDALDAMRKAIDTQVVHEDAPAVNVAGTDLQEGKHGA